ncbi:putative glucokinase [Mycena venus]|uniref:Phosphotransferase n=1 Tax=Mycena venus TaxID=2733690 RepID=A0A8H6XZY3_9AGAR|nr:putative glucokinase [Mycena venus]
MAPSNFPPPTQKELDRIAQLFEVSDEQLVQITQAFGQAFNKVPLGLPTYRMVARQGTALTLDVGWNTVRVGTVTLNGKRSFTTVPKIVEISKEMMKTDAATFFGFLANCVRGFLQENGMQTNSGLCLGFIFAFGTEKASLAHGKLLSWSKGYSITGTVGQDVVELLQTALDKAKVDVKCTALINDTVATLLAQSYLQVPCVMSAIYGVGTNGCYVDKGTSITKLSQSQGTSMMINTEWGAFNERALLRPTIYDDQMDKDLANPGRAFFQKMTCWYYLGEISRQIFLSLVNQSLLFNGVATDLLNKQHSLSSFHLFQIEDASDDNAAKTVICDRLGYSPDSVSVLDIEIVRFVATMVAVRSAKLSACPIASLLTHLGYATGIASKVPVAVDGELFIGSVQFETRLKQGVAAILGSGFDKKLEFHHVQGKGFVGAALATFQATNTK